MSGGCAGMKYHSMRLRYENTCRSCLNKKYQLNLSSADCHYLIYPQKCHSCGEIKNIVSGIRWKKRITLLFK